MSRGRWSGEILVDGLGSLGDLPTMERFANHHRDHYHRSNVGFANHELGFMGKCMTLGGWALPTKIWRSFLSYSSHHPFPWLNINRNMWTHQPPPTRHSKLMKTLVFLEFPGCGYSQKHQFMKTWITYHDFFKAIRPIPSGPWIPWSTETPFEPLLNQAEAFHLG